MSEIMLRLRGFGQVVAAFYLLAYLFWIPVTQSTLAGSIWVFGNTVIPCVGLGLFGLMELLLKIDPTTRVTYWIRTWLQLTGGVVLIYWLHVYIPESGRVVPHWPLDLLVTVFTGIVMFYYVVQSLKPKKRRGSS